MEWADRRGAGQGWEYSHLRGGGRGWQGRESLSNCLVFTRLDGYRMYSNTFSPLRKRKDVFRENVCVNFMKKCDHKIKPFRKQNLYIILATQISLYINFRSIIIESKRIEHVLFLYSISRKFGVEAYLSLYYNRITIFSFRSWFNVAFS